MILPINKILTHPKFIPIRDWFYNMTVDDILTMEYETIGEGCVDEYEIELCHEAFECIQNYIEKNVGGDLDSSENHS